MQVPFLIANIFVVFCYLIGEFRIQLFIDLFQEIFSLAIC